MWRCPRCGRRFANKKQAHSCVRTTDRAHLARATPQVAALYKKFRAMVAKCGPSTMHAVKTRIAFCARMTFAGCHLTKDWLDCGFLLTRRLQHPRLYKVVTYTPRCHGHHFRVTSPAQLDATVQRWLRESYQVGLQAHLQIARGAKKRKGGR